MRATGRQDVRQPTDNFTAHPRYTRERKRARISHRLLTIHRLHLVCLIIFTSFTARSKYYVELHEGSFRWHTDARTAHTTIVFIQSKRIDGNGLNFSNSYVPRVRCR